jgi:hypothetical protein
MTATEEVKKMPVEFIEKRFMFIFSKNFIDKIAKYVEGDTSPFPLLLYVSFRLSKGTLELLKN